MYKLTSNLWYDKRWVSKSGEASLYLQVSLNSKHKEFPLKLKWPVDLIDFANNSLLPRRKKDPDVDDYNLMIMMMQGKHTEILRTYRLKNAPIDIAVFTREVKVFDTRESFTAYMYKHSFFRYNTKDISLRTLKNHKSALAQLLVFDKAWPFEMVDGKWMKRFKSHLINRGYKLGGVWTTIKFTKAYLQYASNEPMLHVDENALSFPNPEPTWKTTFLNKNELRRLLIIYRAGSLTELQQRVLAAFLFQCLTSLRISDVYRVNSKWRITDNYLDFIPKKNEKAQRWVHVPIMPLANHFIQETEGLYFKLPNEAEYNIQLKHIAGKANINKKLTSHVGRHTYGHLYMTTIGNLKGLQEVMGHKKIDTTMRYAHLDDDYQTESVKKIQESFSDLILFRVK